MKKMPTWDPQPMTVAGVPMVVHGADEKRRIEDWLARDPVAVLAASGRDVIDARSFQFVMCSSEPRL